MADDPIRQSQLERPGQTQAGRMPAELGVHYADIDERTPASLLSYARRLAGKDGVEVPFAGPDLKPVEGGWTTFFDAADLTDGKTKAPLALYDAFLHLYDRGPRAAINRLTGAHLDFFYRRVLGFTPRSATPDRVHSIVTLKKGSAATVIGPGCLFSAGKDASGTEQLYSPTADVVVNTSAVASLRSIFVDRTSQGTIRSASVADSADGAGGAFPENVRSWSPFGHAGLPDADVGFAVASEVLMMKEGERAITLTLTLGQAPTQNADAWNSAFEAWLTGETQWLGPYGVTVTPSAAGVMQLRIVLTADQPAVAGYDLGVHAHVYTTDAPVLQLLFKPGNGLSYDAASRLRVVAAQITVEVSGLTDLTLESDAGSLDPKSAFLPFGPQPDEGSRFTISSGEALSKSLSRLDLTLTWKGAPSDFASHYADYTADFQVSNGAFTATGAFRDRDGEHAFTASLFDSADATLPSVVRLVGAGAGSGRKAKGSYVYALSRSSTSWARHTARRMVLQHPRMEPSLRQPPEAASGRIVLSLDRGFLHREYRKQSVEMAIARVRDGTTPLLNEPYTPTLESLSLSYTAQTTLVAVSSTEADDYADLDVQFFHVGPFGQMREHGHQRSELGLGDTQVPLMPIHDRQGELLIGLENLGPGDSVSILFQIAEGSADPDVQAEDPEWFVLCDNYWRRLEDDNVTRDSTNRMLSSGVINFVIPARATTDNTLMPAGLVWLKATTRNDPASASLMVEVAANAVELRWVMSSEDAAAAHLSTALPEGSVTRLSKPIAQVMAVSQPYASFGGRPREHDDALRARAAERLRHKNRAISAWDYERLVLEAFPSVHRVKCIPHARPGSWQVPGHVLVVVVPDLRNRNAPDPLQPRVDADTITGITDFLRERCPGQAVVWVKNPAFQRLQVTCSVKFHPGYGFNHYKQELVQALVRALSPWAFEEGRPLGFGGRVYASALLNLVEEMPYVDYVTDFALRTILADGRPLVVDCAEPAAPDVILVSEASHLITEAA
jgi:hypothetical protein